MRKFDRERNKAGAGDKIRNDEIVQTHRERHERAGDDAGHDLMNDDLGERLERRAAEVERGLDQILVHLLELRHDVQNDIRKIERDVRNEKRPESEHGVGLQDRPREREQQRQRDTGDDIRVRHGDVRHGHDGRAEPALHAVDADGGHRADDGRNERCQQRDDHGVAQQRQECAVTEQIGVLPEREALEAGDVGAGIE